MRIAAIQMTATPDYAANLREAHRLFFEALEKKPDLVAFPEFFTSLTPDVPNYFKHAENPKSVLVETFREWAAENDVWILGGSVPFKAGPKKVSNSSLLFNSEGELVARYDKIHLFDAQVEGEPAYRESAVVKPGIAPVVAKTPWGLIGLSICYDLRFPELYRELSRQGARVIFAPSAFLENTGRAHWDLLTRARAVENLAYVVAPAQTGEHFPGRRSFGHTRIVDPWGRVLAERPGGAGVVWADLDFEALEKRRETFPVLQHRRIGVKISKKR